MNTAPGSDKARYLISATAKWERRELTHLNCFHHRPSSSCHSYNVGVISKIHHAIPFKFFKPKRSLSPLSSRASSGLKNSLKAELSDTCEFAVPEADRCSSPELTGCCDVAPSSPADLDCLRAIGLRSSSWMFHWATAVSSKMTPQSAFTTSRTIQRRETLDSACLSESFVRPPPTSVGINGTHERSAPDNSGLTPAPPQTQGTHSHEERT